MACFSASLHRWGRWGSLSATESTGKKGASNTTDCAQRSTNILPPPLILPRSVGRATIQRLHARRNHQKQTQRVQRSTPCYPFFGYSSPESFFKWDIIKLMLLLRGQNQVYKRTKSLAWRNAQRRATRG